LLPVITELNVSNEDSKVFPCSFEGLEAIFVTGVEQTHIVRNFVLHRLDSTIETCIVYVDT